MEALTYLREWANVHLCIYLHVIGSETGGLRCIKGVYQKVDGVENVTRTIRRPVLSSRMRREDGRTDAVRFEVKRSNRVTGNYDDYIEYIALKILSILQFTSTKNKRQYVNWSFLSAFGRHRAMTVAIDVSSKLNEILSEHVNQHDVEILFWHNTKAEPEIIEGK